MEPNSGRKQAQRMYDAKACEMCGGTTTLQRHHRNGSATDNSGPNISILCQSCHTKVHMMIGDWGAGQIRAASCVVCGTVFMPKRSRRAKLCGNPECRKENGRRSAERRWASRAE